MKDTHEGPKIARNKNVQSRERESIMECILPSCLRLGDHCCLLAFTVESSFHVTRSDFVPSSPSFSIPSCHSGGRAQRVPGAGDLDSKTTVEIAPRNEALANARTLLGICRGRYSSYTRVWRKCMVAVIQSGSLNEWLMPKPSCQGSGCLCNLRCSQIWQRGHIPLV